MVEDDFCREWLSCVCDINNRINELRSQLSFTLKAYEFDPSVGVIIEPLVIDKERDQRLMDEIQYLQDELSDTLSVIRPILNK